MNELKQVNSVLGETEKSVLMTSKQVGTQEITKSSVQGVSALDNNKALSVLLKLTNFRVTKYGL